MASVMEDAGGIVFSVCQALDGRWHVWARFPHSEHDQIDKEYRQTMRGLKKQGAFVEVSRKPRNRKRRR